MAAKYEQCQECAKGYTFNCKFCDGEGYVEVDVDVPADQDEQQFYVSVFWKGDGDLKDYFPVSGYGPVPDSNLFHLSVGVHHTYINLDEVQSFEISPFGDKGGGDDPV